MRVCSLLSHLNVMFLQASPARVVPVCTVECILKWPASSCLIKVADVLHNTGILVREGRRCWLRCSSTISAIAAITV